MHPDLTFVLGGAASGKSAFAEQLAVSTGKTRVYLATSQVFDDEMRDKVQRHIAQRGAGWSTIEAPFDLGPALSDDVLVEYLVDFLGFWQLVVAGLATVLELFTDDVVTELDAFVADKYRRPRDQLANFVLALAAKGAIEEFAVLVLAAGVIAHVDVPL